MKLSVVIANYNVRYFLELCLLSVQEACKQIDYEIIVVDNASKDSDYGDLEQQYSQLHLIKNSKNLGFSKANNLGVQQAKGEYILILNPDTFLAESTILEVMKFAETKLDFGAIGVRYIDGAGEFLPECKRNQISLKIAALKILGQDKQYYANHVAENDSSKVDVLAGAFMFMKKERFDEVSGFDEDYFLYGEDIDLCYRLTKQHYTNYYLGSSTIIHFKGESTVKNLDYLKYFFGAMLIFYKKHEQANGFSLRLANCVINSIIFIKSLFLKMGVNHDSSQINKILYLSDNQKFKDKIQKQYPQAKIQQQTEFNLEKDTCDLVIFDNQYLTNNQIIRYMEHLSLNGVKKRILFKNQQIMLGSDWSKVQGEVVVY